jgi:hypothetical protein
LLNFCVGQLLNIKKIPDQVADATSDMAGLSIKDPEPVPGIWGSSSSVHFSYLSCEFICNICCVSVSIAISTDDSMVPRDILITCHGYLFYSLLTLTMDIWRGLTLCS